MTRIEILHPTDPEIHAEAGHDHAIGWFADVVRPGRRRSSYSAIERNYNHPRPLWGLLAFLVAEKLYSMDNLESALVALQDGTVSDESGEVQRVAGIVAEIKRCGDG